MKVEFIKDFANKKKGDIVNLDGMLAGELINKKVVKKHDEKRGRPKKKVNEPD